MSARLVVLPSTVADLMVGDYLVRDGDEVLVTDLFPATSEEARAYGSREVRSGGWWRTYDAAEPVLAAPGRPRLAAMAAAEKAVKA